LKANWYNLALMATLRGGVFVLRCGDVLMRGTHEAAGRLQAKKAGFASDPGAVRR